MKVEQVDNLHLVQVARILLLLIYVLLVVEGEQVRMVLLLNPVLLLVQVLELLVDLVEVLKVSIQQFLRMVLVDKEI